MILLTIPIILGALLTCYSESDDFLGHPSGEYPYSLGQKSFSSGIPSPSESQTSTGEFPLIRFIII